MISPILFVHMEPAERQDEPNEHRKERRNKVKIDKQKQTSWPESSSEVYRLSEVGANFCGYRVPCGQRDASLRP
jgi:hypothetical protein